MRADAAAPGLGNPATAQTEEDAADHTPRPEHVNPQPKLPALLRRVNEPDRAAWMRRTVSRRARLTGLAGGLQGVRLAVFIVMAEHANGDGTNMRASMFTIGEESGYGVQAARRAINGYTRNGRKVAGLLDDAWVRCDRKSKGGLTAESALNATSTYTVLTLPNDPAGKLAKTKRLSILHPERRQGRFRFNGGRSQGPTSSPVPGTDKHSPVPGTDK